MGHGKAGSLGPVVPRPVEGGPAVAEELVMGPFMEVENVMETRRNTKIVAPNNAPVSSLTITI